LRTPQLDGPVIGIGRAAQGRGTEELKGLGGASQITLFQQHEFASGAAIFGHEAYCFPNHGMLDIYLAVVRAGNHYGATGILCPEE